MERKHTAFLLIGGNIGERENYLAKARQAISSQVGEIILSSKLYETDAWGIEDQAPYINQALQVKTQLSPQNLLSALKTIEAQLGRTPADKWTARVIDCDILFFDNLVMDTPTLTIPHPQFHKRNFAMAPMLDVAPEMMHPTLALTLEELYWDSEDPLDVALLED